MTEAKDLGFNNRNLFSNHFIRRFLPSFREWSEDSHLEAFEELKKRYEAEKPFLSPRLNEASLEERFFRPILRILGFAFEVQVGVEEGLELPDYALFENRSQLARAHRGDHSFYDEALAVCEVKRWDIELDRFGKDRYNRRLNPSYQIWHYLKLTQPKWGILSNGRKWRLYHQDQPLDSYFEVDLIRLLEEDDAETFRYFYYFFRKQAFVARIDEEPFLERVLSGSEDYAREVGEGLKQSVYKALRILAQGFFDIPENALDLTNSKHLRSVQQNAMRLLYRLLFILYAEGKGLLGERAYLRSDYSLYSLKHEIARKRERGEVILPQGKSYWARIKELFSLVDRGSEDFGIPRGEFYVPPYNGGLFDPLKNGFLETKVIGDRPLAETIDLLARTSNSGETREFVDYATLDIRHLGSIYEGLLEYTIQVASEPMVVVGKKDRWATYEEYSNERGNPKPFHEFKPADRAERGALFVSTHRGERKATGSYYTPDHVVQHIVRHTIGKVVHHRWQAASKSDESLTDAVLSIRVLDPAMGSGHFLVGATEFLAAQLLQAVKEDIKAERIEEGEAEHFTMEWAKRQVVSHCIYGVDLNELAVELAKVSLWLVTISKERPLSFLDHRLKQGNSLIESEIVDLGWLPFERPKGVVKKIDKPYGFVEVLVSRLAELESIPDETRDAVKQKERIFEQLKASSEYRRIKSIADVHVGLTFTDSTLDKIRKGYMELVNEALYGNPDKWDRKFNVSWARDARAEAEKREVFHWELEFPEVFYASNRREEDVGFDVVLGNPPYLNVKRGALAEDRAYLKRAFSLAVGQWDAFSLFFERSMELMKKGGYWSMIVPKPCLSSENYEPLRRQWLERHELQSVTDAGTPFEDPAVESVVVVVRNSKPERSRLSVYRLEEDTAGVKLWDVGKDFCLSNPFAIISIRLNEEKTSLLSKFGSIDSTLSDFLTLTRGIEAGKSADFIEEAGSASYPLVFGEDLRPFTFNAFYSLERTFDDSKLKSVDLYEPPKLLIRRVASTIIAAVDTTPAHVLNTIYVCKPTRRNVDLDAVALYLNSQVVNFWFHHIFVFEDRLFPYARISQLTLIPINVQIAESATLSEVGSAIRDCWSRYDEIAKQLGIGLESVGVKFESSAERYAAAVSLLETSPDGWTEQIVKLAPHLSGKVPEQGMVSLLDEGPRLLHEIRSLHSEVATQLQVGEREIARLLGLSSQEQEVVSRWATSIGREDWSR